MTKKAKGNKKQGTIFLESSLALFRLLVHHPHFIQGIAKARKKYGIRITSSVQDVLIWKNDHRSKYHKLTSDLMDLVRDFTAPPQLEAVIREFALDFVFFNKQDNPPTFVAGFKVYKWSEQQQIMSLNPGSIYLEITPTTSEREIRDNWGKIVGERKETRKMGVPKVNRTDERVWELSELLTPKLNGEALRAALKAEFPHSSFLYDEINKRRFTYKQALSKLRPIS